MRRRIVVLEHHTRDRHKTIPNSERFKNIALGVAGVIASIAIPGIGLWLGFIQKQKEVEIAKAQKDQEIQKSYIELGIHVLSDAPKPGTEALRNYAVNLINAHSDVKLEGEAKASVIKDVPLTTTIPARISPQAYKAIVNENTLLGAALSQRDTNANLKRLAEAGIKFCFIRATIGAAKHDSKAASYSTQASEIGMPIGFYHFFDGSEDGPSQARNFIDGTRNMASTLPPIWISKRTGHETNAQTTLIKYLHSSKR